ICIGHTHGERHRSVGDPIQFRNDLLRAAPWRDARRRIGATASLPCMIAVGRRHKPMLSPTARPRQDGVVEGASMAWAERITRGRLHYAWIVAAVCFLALLAAAGVRSAPSVFILPIEQEFGWSRSTLSIAIAVNLLLYGLLAPFGAAFMDRF